MTDGADPFSLWTIPGRKSLVHDGRKLLMRTMLGRQVVRLAVALTLDDGMAYALAVPAGPRLHRAMKAVADFDAALAGSSPRTRKASVSRTDVVHMRSLQALDAHHDGASERDIAELVLGSVDEPDWNDSAHRASIRYLLDHGRRLRDGDYRALLTPKPVRTKPSKSPTR